uniref:U-box domain-containing protein n=1 Tax=Ananas comosus var. bracteatus TaxID=296719 RepID=A0A6V7PPR2_ANACO|nr:unnamed protein product [Ananas comosus var. bracteatus]
MVSLADSQLSASPAPRGSSSSSSSSSPRAHRSLGRSMRTVRSKFVRADPYLPPPGSPAASEALTDSAVDVRLRELAAAKSAEAEAAAAPEELLEISRGFSDYSSFSSDISGELERLASIPPGPAPGPGDREPELGLGASGLWEDDSLGETMEGAGAAKKREAAARLRVLAKHRTELRELIGGAGAIPALVPLLRSADPAAQESAATALLNLSLAEANRAAIAGAPGGIKGLVHALRTGTAAAKQNAACALLSLAMAEEHRAAVGASGAVPALVALMVGGSSRGKKDALTALYKLCALRRNKERAVSAGAAAPLVRMVAERGGGTAEKAMVVLASLAGIPEGSEAIVAAGGVGALVEAVEEGPTRGRELAVHALLQLCADCPQNRALLVREGAIPPLVALSQSAAASARVKHKAEKLLAYLREQRQEGVEATATP